MGRLRGSQVPESRFWRSKFKEEHAMRRVAYQVWLCWPRSNWGLSCWAGRTIVAAHRPLLPRRRAPLALETPARRTDRTTARPAIRVPPGRPPSRRAAYRDWRDARRTAGHRPARKPGNRPSASRRLQARNRSTPSPIRCKGAGGDRGRQFQGRDAGSGHEGRRPEKLGATEGQHRNRRRDRSSFSRSSRSSRWKYTMPPTRSRRS